MRLKDFVEDTEEKWVDIRKERRVRKRERTAGAWRELRSTEERGARWLPNRSNTKESKTD